MSKSRHHLPRLVTALIATAIWLRHGVDTMAIGYQIVTKSEQSAYFAISKDLAKFIAPSAQFDLKLPR